MKRRSPASTSAASAGLHPRNRHRARYDFPRLIAAFPALARFVAPTGFGDVSIDFADPDAVFALNAALLKLHYGISHWTLPPGYLTPPIPGRADYIHHLADLLAESPDGAPPHGPNVRILDIGVGANCIYPILGVTEYGWHFVGADIDPVALASATAIMRANPTLRERVELRLQSSTQHILRGIVQPGERFTAVVCNPPFHASAGDAAAATARKTKNLRGTPARAAVPNFRGQRHELWCRGGEAAFVRRLIVESATSPTAARWFTALVSKSSNLLVLRAALQSVRATETRVIPMAQGQKQSRMIAWRFATA